MLNLREKYVKTHVGIIHIIGNDKIITKIRLLNSNTNFKNHLTFPILEEASEQILEYLKGVRKSFNLPLDGHGTEFQRQVWKELQKIPYGETKSYGEIAKKLGSIQKARAVGGACNKNPFLIVIPCHRVIGGKGDLTGFAAGRDVKRQLLDFESR